MNNRRVQRILVVALFAATLTAGCGRASDSGTAQSIYLADQGSGSVLLSTDGAHSFAPLVDGLDGPYAVAVSNGEVFIVEQHADRVLKVSAEGGTPEPVASDLDLPIGLAASDENLYVSDFRGVFEIPLSGGMPRPLEGIEGASALTVEGDDLYAVVDGSVVRLPLSGEEMPSFVVHGIDSANAIDVADGTVYLTVYQDEGKVVSVPTTGGTVMTVADGLTSPNAVAVSGDKLMITDFGGTGDKNGRVLEVPTSGGQAQVVTEGLEFPSGLTVANN